MKTTNFLKIIESYRKKINTLILSELKKKQPKSLYEPLIYFLSTGGKRLRSIILLLCAESVKKEYSYLPVNQAIAIELLHNFTLIHDDIMDNSDKRHNKLTVHKKYDINTAILSGDSLLALAYDFLGRELKINNQIIYDEFTKALTIVCEGQALDIEFEIRKRVTLNEYFKMISQKTGSLIKYSCRIGALTQTHDLEIVDQLGRFGELIGIAFQIQDDLLDVLGDERVFGKKIGSDLIIGKKTFLLITALQKARGKDLELILKLIQNKGIKPNEIKKYISIYKNLGVTNIAINEINKYKNEASNILTSLSNKIEVNYLEQLLDLITNRKS